MNSMIEKLLTKLRQVMTSHQNIILSLMESFEKEMNEIINFGIEKNNSNHYVKKYSFINNFSSSLTPIFFSLVSQFIFALTDIVFHLYMKNK